MSLTHIVDLGIGNVRSVERAVVAAGGNCVVSASALDVERSDRIILVGVGTFDTAMNALKRLSLIDALTKAALVDKKPILGICLGMSIMGESSEEGNEKGLGWLKAHSVRLASNNGHPVPQIGWNAVSNTGETALLNGIADESEFYFLHSYRLETSNGIKVLSESKYGILFPAIIAKDNLYGVQFHPEKSHAAGRKLIANFLTIK